MFAQILSTVGGKIALVLAGVVLGAVLLTIIFAEVFWLADYFQSKKQVISPSVLAQTSLTLGGLLLVSHFTNNTRQLRPFVFLGAQLSILAGIGFLLAGLIPLEVGNQRDAGGLSGFLFWVLTMSFGVAIAAFAAALTLLLIALPTLGWQEGRVET